LIFNGTIQALSKKMKETNKKYDAHVKTQADICSQHLDGDGAMGAFGELTAVTKDVDQYRDQMCNQIEYTKYPSNVIIS
jgi:hypothetical protein